MFRIEKLGTGLATLLEPIVKEVKETIQFAHSAGVKRRIFFHPLMLGNHNTYFKDGIVVEVVRRNKQGDVLAAGGRSVSITT